MEQWTMEQCNRTLKQWNNGNGTMDKRKNEKM